MKTKKSITKRVLDALPVSMGEVNDKVVYRFLTMLLHTTSANDVKLLWLRANSPRPVESFTTFQREKVMR